ncbi:IS5 family transposase [Myxococcota bacterium]
MESKFSDVPDELWDLVCDLLPPEPYRPLGGRPPVPNRVILAAIVYRLKTGCQWKALPGQFGSGSTCHRRFQEWVRLGVFRDIFEITLRFYDDLVGIDWEWASLDSAMVKAPKGGTFTGPNPTDRAKSGVKRHILTDGNGVPLAAEITGANVHDKWLVGQTLDGVVLLDGRGVRRPKNLCLDKGYDYDDCEYEVRARRIEPHIRRRGESPLLGVVNGKPRRWVVERTNSWHNRYRSLLVRWERKGENYRALLQLACGLIAYHQTL